MQRSLSAGKLIHYTPKQYGGRLSYFGETAGAKYWDDLWTELDRENDYTRAKTGHMPHQLRRTFLRWVPPGSRVLEAGCGFGNFTVAADALGFQADGVDFAPGVIAKLNAQFPEIHFFTGDVRRLQCVPDETYDAVYSPGVCEHFEEGPEQVLRETLRIVRKRGIVVVSTPCFNALHKAVQFSGRYNTPPKGDFYQYAFSRQEMSTILESIGFDIVQVQQYGTFLTLSDFVPVLSRHTPSCVKTAAAYGMDSVPMLNRIGHTCIWVARRRQ
jgi:SAM-dependent methyltransferase